MIRTLTTFTLAAAAVASLSAQSVNADRFWPQWRGPAGSGISDEKNLPERWSATENVTWKASLAGQGVSSPIVFGDRVFVTSQIGSGIRKPGNHPRLAQALASLSFRHSILAEYRRANEVSDRLDALARTYTFPPPSTAICRP